MRRIVLAISAICAVAAAGLPTAARADVAIGTLDCRSPGGFSLVLAFREYSCRFYSDWGRAYDYRGRLTSVGLQAGVTRDEVLLWRVFAPTNRIDSKVLRGTYAGAHAGAAVIVGLGANALVGGSDRTISLQPLSVEAKTGVNFALAGSAFSLY
ncbi:MAG: DUF992 domain-containing protein [Bradyrhizobiaceae bacterium]|nr:DUF992 domain-containing protein [Bradyrhizobiaceae bacterium]